MRPERALAIDEALLLENPGKLSEINEFKNRHLETIWPSILNLTSPTTGFPYDRITFGPDNKELPTRYTSPSNIAFQIFSSIIAKEELNDEKSMQIVKNTLTALSTINTSEFHGFFPNWINTETGQPTIELTRGKNFVSSVDNAWLALALTGVEKAMLPLADQAKEISERMNFSLFCTEEGLISVGFWQEFDQKIILSPYVYETLNSETRICYYVGIAKGEIPPETYYNMFTTPPENIPQSQKPVGMWVNKNGRKFFAGKYTTPKGIEYVPTYNGTIFEALLPAAIIPETEWAPNSWGENHQRQIKAHMELSPEKCRGLWGISPCDTSEGYIENRLPELGINPNPHYSSLAVTPHAIFLAYPHNPEETTSALNLLEKNFPKIKHNGTYFDSVTFPSGTITKTNLTFNQGVIMVSLGHRSIQNLFENNMDLVKEILKRENFYLN